MKILHVIVGLETGGAELMLKRLVQAHAQNAEFRHSIVTLTTVGSVGEQLRAMQVPVSALGMPGPLGAVRALVALTARIRAEQPDIVQTWMYHADLLGGLAARMAGVRAILWGIRTTDLPVAGRATTVAVRSVCARLSRRVPSVIVCAAEAARRVHIAVGYDESKMVVIPNGFELSRMIAAPDEVMALRHACAFGPRDLVVGTVGRYHAAKDHETFVRAASVIARANPAARFLMVGRDVDARNPALASLLAATGYADRFVLLGERSDVPVCLAAMDVFCLHSRNEGFPNVLGEAMAVGVPCVTTNVGDAALLLGDPTAVVPKVDPGALAAAIERMLSRTFEERQRIGDAARLRIREHFTMERAARDFESLYRRQAASTAASVAQP